MCSIPESVCASGCAHSQHNIVWEAGGVVGSHIRVHTVIAGRCHEQDAPLRGLVDGRLHEPPHDQPSRV